ncbi:MAG: hypothetical protein HQL59_13395, partial [Magnetococcales bacterium]|nr:hypothetical protein [Magnetococcales bacterium]
MPPHADQPDQDKNATSASPVTQTDPSDANETTTNAPPVILAIDDVGFSCWPHPGNNPAPADISCRFDSIRADPLNAPLPFKAKVEQIQRKLRTQESPDPSLPEVTRNSPLILFVDHPATFFRQTSGLRGKSLLHPFRNKTREREILADRSFFPDPLTGGITHATTEHGAKGIRSIPDLMALLPIARVEQILDDVTPIFPHVAAVLPLQFLWIHQIL